MRLICITGVVMIMSITNSMAQSGGQETPKLTEVASFGRYRPIGVAITATGRTFVTFPRMQTYEYGLAELVNKQKTPYPNAEWNNYDSLQAADHFMNTQVVWPDNENHLWVLDPSNPGDKATVAAGVKLLDINLATNKIERIYRFEDLPREQISLNDVRVDTKRRLAYLSEPKTASIVILDLNTGNSRMVLTKDRATIAEPGFKLHLDGKDVVDNAGNAFSSNINGIALTHDFRWFYFRAINQTKLYRIAVDDLVNSALSKEALSQKVQMVAETGVSHGMLADDKGNIYLSDSPGKAIRYVRPDGKLQTLVQDERLIWPDTFTIGNDGFLYLTCAQINRDKKYNKGVDKTEYPYRLYKVKLP